MNREEYAHVAHLMNQIPPKKETPEGQKFHIGEIVTISNPCSWFAKERNGEMFEVQYSSCQKFGGSQERQKKQYSLRHLWEDNSSAWYDEEELELIKGIGEITEENDKAEYERLKAKYEQ